EMATNSAMIGADLSQVHDAADIAAAKKSQGHQGLEDRLRHIMKTEGICFEQAKRRGKRPLTGTPAMIADYMQDLFEFGGCDGFVISPTIFPGMFEDFGRMVVPELQRRGLFRKEYAGLTMRENLRSYTNGRKSRLSRRRQNPELSKVCPLREESGLLAAGISGRSRHSRKMSVLGSPRPGSRSGDRISDHGVVRLADRHPAHHRRDWSECTPTLHHVNRHRTTRDHRQNGRESHKSRR